jgi:hypothetical protein
MQMYLTAGKKAVCVQEVLRAKIENKTESSAKAELVLRFLSHSDTHLVRFLNPAGFVRNAEERQEIMMNAGERMSIVGS